MELCGHTHQLFACLIADDRTWLAALLAVAVLLMAGDDLYAPVQMLGQRVASGVLRAWFASVDGLFRLALRLGGFLLDFLRTDADLPKEQLHLVGGELLTLGSPKLQAQQLDLVVLLFDGQFQQLGPVLRLFQADLRGP